MMKHFRLLLPVLLSAATAFSASTNEGLDINDVAVLFPLDELAQPVPEIRLSQDDGNFINPDVYKQLIGAAQSAGIASTLFDNFKNSSVWAVVAYRVDPCAPVGHQPPGGACSAELRLVLQPSGPFGGPIDSALHLIYDINDTAASLYDAVKALKNEGETSTLVSTNGRPLGVHPQIQAAAMSAFGQDLPKKHKAFLREFATSDRMKKATIMGLRGDLAVDWIFLGGDVANNRWVQGTIPNLPRGVDKQIEFDRRAPASFIVKPVDPKLSTYSFFEAPYTRGPNDLSFLNEAVHRLENPDLSNRNTSDCVSCHSATTVRLHPMSGAPVYLPGLSASIPAGITAFPDVMTLQNDDLHWNLRALGYFDDRPTLSMRSVMEASRSADAINRIRGWKNPGKSCSKNQAAAMSCFVLASTQEGAGRSAEDCLKICE